MRLIPNKQEAFRLSRLGLLGNFVYTTYGIHELVSKFQELDPPEVGMRYAGTGSGGKFVDGIKSVRNLEREYKLWKDSGVKDGEILFTQSLPDDWVICRGELQENPILNVRYSTTPGIKFRESMATSKYAKKAEGLSAKLILEHFMDFESYSSVLELLHRYPGSVIEFGVYCSPVGLLRLNTIIWEVRYY